MPNSSSDVRPVSLRVQSGNSGSQEGDQPLKGGLTANDAGNGNGALGVLPLMYDATGGTLYALRSVRGTADGTNGAQIQSAGAYAYNSTWDRVRTPNVFKVVALGAGTTETTIWTPTSGKKFRLMGFVLTCGAASTLTFKDNTAGTTIFAARGVTDTAFSPSGLGNGILSAAANNVLTVTRGTSATLDGVVWGTEE